MSRCELSAKSPVVKNRVSHSHIKTKTKVFPNVQRRQLFSGSLGETFRFKVAASTLKSLEHMGGLDPYILGQDDGKLSRKALLIKNRIVRKLKAKKTTSAAKPAKAAKTVKA